MAIEHQTNPDFSQHLQRWIHRAEVQLLENETSPNATDSLIYAGNWQDAIPRAIWTDPRLDAIDVRAWGVIRTQLRPNQAMTVSINTVLIEQLGYSKPTVSRILYILRLSRWVSLCATVRDRQGRFRGHVYAIHDEPLNLCDAIQLDPGYIVFAKQQLQHKHPRIRHTARSLLIGIEAQIHDNHDVMQPVDQSKLNLDDRKPTSNASHQVNKLNLAEVKLDAGTKNQRLSHQVNEMNLAPITTTPCCSSSFIKNTTTTSVENSARAREGPESENVAAVLQQSDLVFPDGLNHSERELAVMYLKPVETELKQSFLDELAGQMRSKKDTARPIGNPIGYLCWMCNQHYQGQVPLTSCGIRVRDTRERAQRIKQRTHETQAQIAHRSLAPNSGDTTSRLARRLDRLKAGQH